jgi:hypothetical protein
MVFSKFYDGLPKMRRENPFTAKRAKFAEIFSHSPHSPECPSVAYFQILGYPYGVLRGSLQVAAERHAHKIRRLL